METDLVKKNIIPLDGIALVQERNPKFKSLPKKEYLRLLFDTELEIWEICMLQAYCIFNCLDRFEYEKNYAGMDFIKNKMRNGEGYSWIWGWKEEFGKQNKLVSKLTNIQYATKHLEKVIKYIKDTYNSDYVFAWLVDYENVLYDLILSKVEKGNYNGKQKRYYSKEDYPSNGTTSYGKSGGSTDNSY